MFEKIKNIFKEIEELSAKNIEDIEQLRIKYLSKKGIVTELFNDFKNVTPVDRKEVGKLLNDLKNSVQEKITILKNNFQNTQESNISELDLTLPVNFNETGSRHPLSLTRKKIVEIFSKIGFNVAEGPEIEDDWHNFSALNFPQEHPARHCITYSYIFGTNKSYGKRKATYT